MAIFNIDISQGSVATWLRHSGIFRYEFTADLLLSLKRERILKIRKHLAKLDKTMVSCFFRLTVYMHIYWVAHKNQIETVVIMAWQQKHMVFDATR